VPQVGAADKSRSPNRQEKHHENENQTRCLVRRRLDRIRCPEAKAASKDGSITKGPSPAQKPMSSGGKEKRAEVKAEGKAAERSGQAITEVSPAPKPTRSAKTRAQVKAEAKAAAKAGEIPQGEAGIVKGKP
jgi:hypothetical protein